MAFRRTPASSDSPRGVQRTLPFAYDPDQRPAFLPGVDFRKQHGVLMQKFDAAEAALRTVGFLGLRMEVIVLLDGSTSMKADYRTGLVGTMLQRALVFALPLAPSHQIPVVVYETRVRKPTVIDTSNYQRANELIGRPDGWTNMADAYLTAIDMAKRNTLPTMLINITDGNPRTDSGNNERRTTSAIMDTSSYPIFNKILSVRPVTYLQQLDDMESRVEIHKDRYGNVLRDAQTNLSFYENHRGVRLIDNVDAKSPEDFHPDPYRCSDADFAQAMVEELEDWIEIAAHVGILTGVPGHEQTFFF